MVSPDSHQGVQMKSVKIPKESSKMPINKKIKPPAIAYSIICSANKGGHKSKVNCLLVITIIALSFLAPRFAALPIKISCVLVNYWMKI